MPAGSAREQLIEQAPDGTLLLGGRGERIVNRHSFYAVFWSPEEYRPFSGGKLLGTLPITQPVQVEMHLIFAGRRWQVLSVEEQQKVIDLAPSPGGKVPLFTGSPGQVHDRVRQEMLQVYLNQVQPPAFLDARAKELFQEARDNFFRLGLDRTCLLGSGMDSLFFVWAGDRVRNTVTTLMVERGLKAAGSGLTISVAGLALAELAAHLEAIAGRGPADAPTLARSVKNPEANKYDVYLSPELLALDYAARELEPAGAHSLVRQLVDSGFRPPVVEEG
ncbi:MAG: hypothetical protein HYV63_01060 [Candidatus Schekmanbacteria bacterium]|nr:hypothetical protein [Candidatus Schekmanbacteria bacterium]